MSHRSRSRLFAILVLLVAVGASASAGAAPTTNQSSKPLTLAVIGDTPYGASQLAAFPSLVEDVNRDPKVRGVLHLGDIKTGSSPCTSEYFATVAGLFETFADPLVYTPGDNEWTDCHRAGAGGYDPLGRLDAVRATFFAEPGRTLGRHEAKVLTQGDDPAHATYVENVRWVESQVAFATVHVVGSNNDLAPWFGSAETPEQRARRLAEFDQRLAADLAWIDQTFDIAEAQSLEGVVLAMQADMWDAFSVANALPLDGFTAIVRRIASRARAFGGQVLILQGDSHRFLVDNPLATGDPVHGVAEPVPNLTRIVVEGETSAEWLRLTIDPASPQLFRWERVPV